MTKSPMRCAIAVLGVVVSVSGCRCGSGQQTGEAFGEIRVVYEENGVTLSGESGAYDFGTVSQGKVVRLAVRVQNAGRGTLTVDAFEQLDGTPVAFRATADAGAAPTEAAVFALAYAPLTDIASGETQEFALTFAPPLDGLRTRVDFAATLRLRALNTAADKDTALISVTGTGIAGVCELPQFIDFGAVARGDTAQAVVVLRNGQPIDTLAFVGDIVSAQGERVFTVTSESPQGEFSLNANQERRVTFVFAPTEAHQSTALVILRAAEGCPEARVRLRGAGVDQVLTWMPEVIDFGYVVPEAEALADVVFSNQAIRPVEVADLSPIEGGMASAVFRVVDTGGDDRARLTVPAATLDEAGDVVPGTATVKLGFRPQVRGARKGELRASVDLRGQSALAVVLKGVGGGPVIEVKPSPTVSFGRIAFFAQAPTPTFATRRVTVQNVGTKPTAPDAKANLRLGANGAGAPYWRVEARNAETSLEELCVGSYDTAADLCVGALAPTYDPLVGLEASGVKAMLDVPLRVTPRGTGQKEWAVTFYSNDPRTPEVTVGVVANVVSLPPCNLSVRPLNLNFGVVTPPAAKDLSFEVRNLGAGANDVCLLTNLDLRAGSDPMFQLPAGVVPEKELQAGEAWVVPVRVWVQGALPGAPTPISGAVLFNVSSPSVPQQTVTLQATLAPSCLAISPGSLDFGTVQRGCNSPDRTFQAYNTCAAAITIVSASMVAPAGEAPGAANCAGPAPCPEFLTVSAPAAVTIAAGNSTPVSFALKYRPINSGADSGAFLIRVNQGGQLVDYVVALLGRGDAVGMNTDTFRQDIKPKADILLIVDNSGSMADKQRALADNFNSFIKYASASHVDFQIGVTSTDMSAGQAEGRIVPSPAGVRLFTPTTPNLEQQFKETVNLGTDGSGTETCLEPAVAALTAPLVADPSGNLGLLRQEAVLAVVCVTDAVDQSSRPASYYLNQLMNIKGAQRQGAFTYNVVGPFSSATATCQYDSVADDGKHAFMVNQTNGIKEEICTPDWAKALENIGKGAFGYRTNFFLTARPDTEAGKVIVVEINGSPLPPVEPSRTAKVWDYEPATNSINFQPLYVPQPGDTLTVSYQVACIP